MAKRYDWVDIARAIAIIFVYIGHWQTPKLGAFAYSFDLFLFFMVSGFFAMKNQKYTFIEFLKKEIKSLIIPIFLWAWIAIIISNLDNPTSIMNNGINLFTNVVAIQTNYWFIPAIFSVSIVYYLLLKLIKKIHCNEFVLLLILVLINYMFGEVPVISEKHNIFLIITNLPVINIISNWFSIMAIPTYLFWYSFGSLSFEKINSILELKNTKNLLFNFIGFFFLCGASILLLKGVYDINGLQNYIYYNNLTLNTYKILVALIIIFAVIYLCSYLEKSEVLKNIGKNTLALMGLEFITHDLVTLTLLPMLNLGIPNINSTLCVLIIVIIQFVINMYIIKFLVNCFPILNGKNDSKTILRGKEKKLNKREEFAQER